mmetsp:Transcript_33232/g.76308  ORF Transcript_33232/g.76308 Transcript_33232/m.76308 type:complete len:107 (+) Transcript_33232:418-738(+)
MFTMQDTNNFNLDERDFSIYGARAISWHKVTYKLGCSGAAFLKYAHENVLSNDPSTILRQLLVFGFWGSSQSACSFCSRPLQLAPLPVSLPPCFPCPPFSVLYGVQ